jgi:SAM-dependent methyltransferase
MYNSTEELKRRILSIKLENVIAENAFRDKVVASLDRNMTVLDCGKSLRNKFEEAQNRVRELRTLDINVFRDYPDYVIDLCNDSQVSTIGKKFDVVINFSLLEHTYDPFAACRNLFSLTMPGGKIIGSAPFLFPRHSPSDLSYQDYFRFTRDAYAVLFPYARNITLYPLRGRLATSINVLTFRYRFYFEKHFPKLGRFVSKILSSGDHLLQASGYGFIIEK